ncbi:MAG: hypothetical protein OXQ94_17045 [Gemmatimonadota bacterium]|nr:hypothetical protein [Gemmatimonadota bacterium]MDE2873387.1 hypothetical protein [Gemmatimonadota bacterium]
MKNRTMERGRRLGLCAAVVIASGACLDLNVTNPNAPDRERAIVSASDIQALISGSFRGWFDIEAYFYPGSAMLVAADGPSSSWANFGMRDASQEPRKAYDNDPAYTYNALNRLPWIWAYRSLAGARDGLAAIKANPEKLAEELGGQADLDRLVAFGKLVQGLSLSTLALNFDRAFVVDEETKLDELELMGYPEVWDAAAAKLGEAIQLSQGAAWSIPRLWIGCNEDWSASRMVEIARAYRARYTSQLPRTPAERESLDWAAIKSDATSGFSNHFAGLYNACLWGWDGIKWPVLINPGWGRTDYRTIGPADASGEWEKWINAPPEGKRPFNIDTDDRRITGGNYNDDGMYMEYYGTSPYPADRGLYHYSHYKDYRWDYIWVDQGFIGEWIKFDEKELDFLAAEADFRLGNKTGTMSLVNKYRLEHGMLPPFASVDDRAPGGNRCVPQNPDGSCGDLWEAYKYEKRIEVYGYGYGTEFFDDRGWGDLVEYTWTQVPIPGSELEILLMDIYTFGGPGGNSSAYLGTPQDLSKVMDFRKQTPEALRMKRKMLEAWNELNVVTPDEIPIKR